MSSADRQAAKAAAFRALHQGEPFVIPNPWDAGSARVLEALGFRALATTSSGFAFTLGRRDGGTLDEMVDHARALDQAELPVSVDLENGYGPDPRCRDRDPSGGGGGRRRRLDRGLRPRGVPLSAGACRRTDHSRGRGRSDARMPVHAHRPGREPHPRNPDLRDTIRRLQAFEEAGADVLFAPGLQDIEDIRAVCGSVDRPVNVLGRPGLTFEEIVGAGAQRVSVGGSLTWVAVRAFTDAATAIAERQDLSVLDAKAPPAEWLER